MKSKTIVLLWLGVAALEITASLLAQTPPPAALKGSIGPAGKAELGPSKASALPPEEIALYWRATSEVNMAQLNFEHRFGETPEARAVKDAGTERQKVIDRLSGMCGPGRVLQSASEADSQALKVPKDTPVCAVPAVETTKTAPSEK